MADLQVGPLIRAVSSRSVVIWAELTVAESITLTAQSAQSEHTVEVSGKSVTIGGHHYITLQLQHLQPATWYDYTITRTQTQETLISSDLSSLHQCFRTLDPAPTDMPLTPSQPSTLRIAYGSCRKAEETLPDAFNAFGAWIRRHMAQREQLWPHILLLIGDQVYADEPPTEIVHTHPHIAKGAVTFEDFALLYHHAWTYNEDVRQAFAVIPTYMIFDDHEVTNDWNGMPDWRARVLNDGAEQTLVDGLVAYWIYQGWGNLDQDAELHHPLLALMQAAAQSGEDILEQLRDAIKADVYGLKPLSWHYQIPTQPSIFVMNARTERTAIFDHNDEYLNAPTRIASQQQMADLQRWLATNDDAGITLLVSSVPVLLPPAIGLSEYIMGKRPFYQQTQPLRWLGQKLAHIQRKISAKMNFDHWPLYPITWHELIQILRMRKKDTLVLSGDVHFSYAIKAQYTSTSSHNQIYQFVSTPLQNALDNSSQQKIELQGRITTLSYGGLRNQILPLQETQPTKMYTPHITHNLLMENAIAMVTIQQDEKSTYQLQQKYMGIIDGELQVIARTVLSH
jgi:phosphodiesterase/alkaline phosphatase D-like protein